MQLWGLNPLGYHLGNVGWLALAVVALFGLVGACDLTNGMIPA